MFYTLRYLPTVPLNRRKHGATLVRCDTADDAEVARQALPSEVRDLLEVVVRGDER